MDVEEKQVEKNPNAGRKSNGPKALSNGEFMIAFGDENSAVASDSRNDVNNEPVNTESTSSQTIVIESSAMEAASSESINTSSEELTVLEEFATVRELLVEQEQNPEETATDSNVFDFRDDDEAEEADIPIPEEDEQAGEDKDSVLEEYFLPGAMITAHDNCLRDFGNPPFEVVVRLSELRTYKNVTSNESDNDDNDLNQDEELTIIDKEGNLLEVDDREIDELSRAYGQQQLQQQYHNRVVLPPEELYPLIKKLFETYGPLRCARTGRPLFDFENWRQAKNVLSTIHLGHVSDPPNKRFYFVHGRDKDGLTLYRCSRGTNSLEGGIHQNLIRSIGAFDASVEYVDALLADYRLRHNIDISQHINNLESKLNVPCSYSGPGIHAHSLHLNSSNELFGISPLPLQQHEWNHTTLLNQTPEQLNSYFTKWKEIDNIKRTKNNNKEIIEKVSKDLNSSIRKRAAPPAQYPSPSKAPRTGIIAQTDSNFNSSAIATHRSNSPSLIRPAPPSINTEQLAAFMFHQLMSQQLPSSIPGIPLNTRHGEQSFSSGLPSLQPLDTST
ncbi:hypothetical protein INT45_009770 [Circinella minor]|uniref:Uncharacterized protein n=1 Tax=Circinella minor TaxID=1195481 RepID=A0A8H7RH80_9FUNG|nr:hypothetical protein INT45_009770 [Circinella minor]